MPAEPPPAPAIPGFRCRRLGAAAAPARTLLLHGFTGTAEDWREAWPGDSAALALDLPGHGGSLDPAGGFVASLRSLLAALPAGIDRVAGYSLGGRLALGLLCLAPARFRAAVVISAHPGLMDTAARAERRAAERRWIASLHEGGIAAFVDAWEGQALFATQAALPRARLAAQRARRLAQRPAGLAASLACHGLAEMPDLRPAIRAYPGRLHWVTGTADARFDAIADEIEALRPSLQRWRLAGIGHNPLLEAPQRLREQLAQALAADAAAADG